MNLLNKKQSKKYLRLLKKFQISIVLVLLGTALVGAGLSTQGLFKAKQAPQFTAAEESSEKITVDISGAVNKPGVYSFERDTRLIDAVEASGGFSENADNTLVASSINLASKLADGHKIYIPIKGVAGTATVQTSGKININSASGSQLDSLPGIGEARSAKIIEGRPYTSIEELVSKKILGESVFENIKGQISVY